MAATKIDEKDFSLIEEANDALMALEVDHFRVIEDQKIDQKKSLEDWKSFLKILDTYDRVRDLAVQKLRTGSWRNFGTRIVLLGIIGSIILFIWFRILQIDVPFWVFFILVGIFSLAGLIYRYSPQGRKYAALNKKLKTAEKLDFPNSIRNFIIPLVDFFKEECRTGTSLELFFNLSKRSFNKGNDTLKPNFKTRSGYMLKQTDYSDYDYVRLNTRLYDGTVLVYLLNDQIRRRYFSRTKRSVSGKYKTKTKYKYKVKITHTLKLIVPKKIYKLRSTIPPDSDSIQIIQSENDKKYIFKARGVRYSKVNLSRNHQPDLQDLLNLMSEVYKRLERVEATT